MHIGILTTHLSQEEERLIEEAEAKGHKISVLEVLKFGISVCPDDPRVYYEGQRIGQEFDVIIPRIDPPHTQFGFMVLRQFQAMGIYTTDTAYSLELCRDKLRCLQYLMRKEVPFPTTGYAYAKEDYSRIINTVGGAPVVIKLNEGTEGIGVFLAEDKKNAKNFLKTFKQFDAQVMIQEFIAESSGKDIRVVVLDGEIVGAFQRTSQDGDFRANIAQGGHASKVDLTEVEQEISLKATAALGLSLSGVDIIRSSSGPLVIEVNSAIDFAGPNNIEDLHDYNMAGAIIDFAIEGKARYDSGEGVWLQKQQVV